MHPHIESVSAKAAENKKRMTYMDNIQRLTHNHSNFERKKNKMMICDDEPDVLLLFECMFRSKYDIILADSGEECIEKYIEETNRGNKISLVLLDYELGGTGRFCRSKNKRAQRD